jgi:hypothetical protein
MFVKNQKQKKKTQNAKAKKLINNIKEDQR